MPSRARRMGSVVAPWLPRGLPIPSQLPSSRSTPRPSRTRVERQISAPRGGSAPPPWMTFPSSWRLSPARLRMGRLSEKGAEARSQPSGDRGRFWQASGCKYASAVFPSRPTSSTFRPWTVPLTAGRNGKFVRHWIPRSGRPPGDCTRPWQLQAKRRAARLSNRPASSTFSLLRGGDDTPDSAARCDLGTPLSNPREINVHQMMFHIGLRSHLYIPCISDASHARQLQ